MVFNVALRVHDTEGCVNRLSNQNVQIIKPLQTISDLSGSVRMCSIKSCVGNVVHTLVDDSRYSGLFLPGFVSTQNCGKISSGKNEAETWKEKEVAGDLHYIDHVTLCTHCGSSASVISWYGRCFGMKQRFIIYNIENEIVLQSCIMFINIIICMQLYLCSFLISLLKIN